MHEDTPVIRSIARMIHEHRLSHAEIARALDLSPVQLGHRLALMVRQGFLLRERPCDHGNQVGCCRCCGSSGRGCEITGYGLTEKGFRLAGAQSRDSHPTSGTGV